MPVEPVEVATIWVVPGASAMACPAASTVATAGLVEAQVTAPVRSPVLLSLKVPVAVNCWVWVGFSWAAAGLTAMEVSVGWAGPVTVASFSAVTVAPEVATVAVAVAV